MASPGANFPQRTPENGKISARIGQNTLENGQNTLNCAKRLDSAGKAQQWALRLLREVPSEDLLKRDVLGRNILHTCIISNNTQRLAELLRHPAIKAIYTDADYENGWNVLHYAFFLKKMACLRVLFLLLSESVLLELLKRKDRRKRTPMQLIGNNPQDFFWVPEYINENDQYHVTRRTADNGRLPDRRSWWTPTRGASDAYTFGSNVNGSLGVGNTDDRLGPTPVALPPAFVQSRDRIAHLHVSAFHSLLVTVSGLVYTCGNATRGRLGLGNSHNASEPTVVPLLYAVAQCAVSNTHNLALSTTGRLFSWGLNTYGQLGYESSSRGFGKGGAYENTVQEIRFFRKTTQPIRGIAASNVHSVAFTEDTLFFWGLNIGQMGIPFEHEEFQVGHVTYSGSVQDVPKSVLIREKARQVEACEACTFVLTETNEVVYFLQNQRAKLPKIAPRVDTALHFEVFKPSAMTRAPQIAKISAKSPETVFLLLDTGDILQCCINAESPKTSTYQAVWTPSCTSMRAVDIDTSTNGSLILCTLNGSGFQRSAGKSGQKSTLLGQKAGTAQSRSGSATKKSFLPIDKVNRVVRVSCSDTFSSFGLLRDDIDALPYKLQKNDIFKDMEYLSPLVEPDVYRKQDQLLDTDHEINCYLTQEFGGEKSGDRLFQAYTERHTVQERPADTYQKILPVELEAHRNVLRSCTDRASFHVDWLQQKFCDGQIKAPGITLGFHHGIFRQRSAFFRRIFEGNDEFFVHQNIKGRYIPGERGIILFETHVEPLAILVFVHFVYTNTLLDFWDVSSKVEKEHQIRRDFRDLMALFQTDLYSDAEFLRQLGSLETGNVVIGLADGRVLAEAALLCRSAFFETILAWDHAAGEKNVALENVTSAQMDVILRHLHGCSDRSVLSPENMDPDEFVNFALEMIEVSDELLLVQLKRLCELAIQTFINVDNVLVLLSHADYLSASKLFMSCCWYIYNNLEVVVFDAYLRDVDEELLLRVEKVLEFLDRCKIADFVVGEKGEINWNVKSATLANVDAFLFDGCYNEQYMSDRKGFSSFEPIFESSESGRRKLSRRSKTERSFSMSEVRADLRKLALAETECAVEDEFELVRNKKDKSERRGSKVERKVSEPGERRISQSVLERRVSLTLLERRMSLTVQERKTSAPVEKPDLDHETVERTALLPVLGQKAPVLGAAEDKRSKIKFSPAMKLSQKERKKQGKTAPERVELRNPWAQPSGGWGKGARTGSTESSTRESATWGENGVSAELTDLPILGQEPIKAPKLSSIILEDATRAAQPQKPAKTLQEIQQEQEFARWWEEECKRVQMEEEAVLRLSREAARGNRRGRGRGRGKKGL